MTLFGRTSPSEAEAERAHRRRWILIPGVVVLLCVVVGLVSSLGPWRTREEAIERLYPAGIKKIQVENPGDVALTGTTDGQARALWETHWNYQRPSLRTAQDGDTLRVWLDCSRSVGVECFADVQLAVPQGVAVQVGSDSGDVLARGLDSPVTVSATSGEVSMRDVTGDVRVSMRSGDMNLRGIGGNVTAQNRSGDIHAKGLNGRTAALSTQSGDVNATFAVVPQHVTAQTRSGDVQLCVPPGSGPYQVRTDVRSGDVRTEVPTSTTATSVLDARTHSGDVEIRYGDHEDGPREPPEPPEPPQPPQRPGPS